VLTRTLTRCQFPCGRWERRHAIADERKPEVQDPDRRRDAIFVTQRYGLATLARSAALNSIGSVWRQHFVELRLAGVRFIVSPR